MAENVTLEKVLLGDTTKEYVDKVNKAIDNVNSNSDAIEDLTEAVANAGKVDGVKVNDISVVSNKIANVKVNGSDTVKVETSGTGEITISAPTLAKSLTLSVDPSTYVLTATLKDSNGNVLSAPTVDLPLETMVVNASYDETTKEIVLTLQNGTTTRFSVADLVAGLVSTEDLATTSKNGLMSSTDKAKLDRIDSSLEGVTADQIGKVKDVKVNGASVLGSDGVAAITTEDLKAGYVSVSSGSLVNYTVDGTTYKAIKVVDTDTALEVYNSSDNKILTHTVREGGYLYIFVGTKAIACTLRKINGNSVSGGSTGDDVDSEGFRNAKWIKIKDNSDSQNRYINSLPLGGRPCLLLISAYNTMVSGKFRQSKLFIPPYNTDGTPNQGLTLEGTIYFPFDGYDTGAFEVTYNADGSAYLYKSAGLESTWNILSIILVKF